MLSAFKSSCLSKKLAEALADESLFLVGCHSIDLMALANGIDRSFNLRLTATHLGSLTLNGVFRTLECHQLKFSANTKIHTIDAVAEYHSLISQLNSATWNRSK